MLSHYYSHNINFKTKQNYKVCALEIKIRIQINCLCFEVLQNILTASDYEIKIVLSLKK